MEGKGGGSPRRLGGGSGVGTSNLPPATTFAQWPNNVMIDLLKKYEELRVANGNYPNFTPRMWKVIMEHINGKCRESGLGFVYSIEQVKSKVDSLTQKNIE